MLNFIEWMILENSQSLVTIDDRELRLIFAKQREIYIDAANQTKKRLDNFDEKEFFNNIKTTLANYPLLKNLLRSLYSKNWRYILDQNNKIRLWIADQPYKSTLDARKVTNSIYDYITFIEGGYKYDEHIKSITNEIELALQGTQEKMNVLKNRIEEAINNLKWNGSRIIIKPIPGYGYNNQPEVETTSFAEVVFDNNTGTKPSFTISQENNEIDDIIEGGDEDFFNTMQLQSDYFNLIKELKNPGSSQKGKRLRLYTARPAKDRQFFINSKILPVNLFLANDYDHVEGLARDLSSKEPRDIWKVVIDSKYLTQTLDGRIKYYQVTTPDAPIISMELLS